MRFLAFATVLIGGSIYVYASVDTINSYESSTKLSFQDTQLLAASSCKVEFGPELKATVIGIHLFVTFFLCLSANRVSLTRMQNHCRALIIRIFQANFSLIKKFFRNH